MRRAVVGLILLVVAPRAIEAERQPLTQPKAAPPARISIAAPVDSMRPGSLYLVSGNELIPSASHLQAVGAEESLLEFDGPTSELEIVQAQPHFRGVIEASEVRSLRLGVLEVRGDRRRARMTPNKADFFKKTLPLEVQEVQPGLYDLAPRKPLGAGEYAIGWHLRYDIGTFVMIRAEFTIQAPPSGQESQGSRR